VGREREKMNMDQNDSFLLGDWSPKVLPKCPYLEEVEVNATLGLDNATSKKKITNLIVSGPQTMAPPDILSSYLCPSWPLSKSEVIQASCWELKFVIVSKPISAA
jgi:hypothetical protein